MNTWDAYGVTVREWLIPKSMTKIRPGRQFPGGKAKTQTIHETANYNPGVNALATVRYLHNGAEGRTVSYHCAIDDREVVVALPFAEHGWHAGDGAGPGNYTSFAIEICVNSDGDFNKAIDNAARFSAWLHDHGHGVEGIVQHNHWSGKHCPRLIRDRGIWSQVVELSKKYRGGVTAPSKEPKPVGMTAEEKAYVESLGAQITAMNQKLAAYSSKMESMYSGLAAALYGKQYDLRMSDLAERGVSSLEFRINRIESENGPIVKRIRALEDASGGKWKDKIASATSAYLEELFTED